MQRINQNLPLQIPITYVFSFSLSHTLIPPSHTLRAKYSYTPPSPHCTPTPHPPLQQCHDDHPVAVPCEAHARAILPHLRNGLARWRGRMRGLQGSLRLKGKFQHPEADRGIPIKAWLTVAKPMSGVALRLIVLTALWAQERTDELQIKGLVMTRMAQIPQASVTVLKLTHLWWKSHLNHSLNSSTWNRSVPVDSL